MNTLSITNILIQKTLFKKSKVPALTYVTQFCCKVAYGAYTGQF